MSLVALFFVFVAAWCHAGWNVLAKRCPAGVPFTWLMVTTSVVIYAPLALVCWFLSPPMLSLSVLMVISVSGLLHLCYFLWLQYTYRQADLSIIYPIARGTGPLLVAVFAAVVFRESLSLLQLGGLFSISGGIVLITWRSGNQHPHFHRVVLFGGLTGVCIALYTLWDTNTVLVWHLSPVLFNYGIDVVRFVLLLPSVRHRSQVCHLWVAHRRAIVGVALLSPLAYLLILFAYSFAPINVVAPTREIGILFGVLLGVLAT